MAKNQPLGLDDVSAPRIYTVRGEGVVIDRDVARLFGVETKAFNQQVKRNKDKFGDDFTFRLTLEEYEQLRKDSDTVVSGRGGAPFPTNWKIK